MARPWRETFWYRIPRAVGRPGLNRALALLTALLTGVPSLAALIWGRRWVPTFARWALDVFTESQLGRQLLENLEPARRAALPARMEAEITHLLPLLALMGLVAAIAGTVAVLLLGKFLARTIEVPDPASAPATGRTSSLAPLLAFLAGLAAHLFALRQSLNTDEGAAAFHALTHWWSWADTRIGWQTHMGGELLATIGMGIFGQRDWAARLPLALCSAAGLALIYPWIQRRRGTATAILTVGLICALPLWSEQATLVRGYGLLFLAGALMIPALWDVLDGAAAGREPRALAMLFFGSLLGFLAHFFFFFLAVTTLGLLAWHAWRHRSALAAAGSAWVALGLVLPGLLYFPGLPVTLYQSKDAARLPASTVPLRFVEALGFDLTGAPRWIGCVVVLALGIEGLRRLPGIERRRIAVLVLGSLAFPFVLRPVYLYPRFFIHLLPLAFVVVWPLTRLRLPAVAAVALSLVLWAFPRPWQHQPAVDLRGGAEELRQLAHPGEKVYVDRFFTTAQFYLRGVRTEAVLLWRGVPADARLLLAGCEQDGPEPVFPGFHVVDRRSGRELKLLVYEADHVLEARSPENQ